MTKEEIIEMENRVFRNSINEISNIIDEYDEVQHLTVNFCALIINKIDTIINLTIKNINSIASNKEECK